MSDFSYYNFYLSNDFKEKLEEAVALAKQEGVLAAHSIMPDMNNPLGFGDCHFYRDDLFITWDGFLTLCCISPFPKDLNFGNVFEMGLERCINGEDFLRYRKLYEEKLTPQICKRCYLLSEDIIKNYTLGMKGISQLEEKIYNEGERLIPGVTHDIAEFVRHRSSYLFFKKVIEHDMKSGLVSKPVKIVDLGCGVGHGCYTLSEIPGAEVVGIDFSPESLEYANRHYARANISYHLGDLQAFMSDMPEYDYVVSRGVLEHIPNGLQAARSAKWRNRLLIDVPYDEPDGNPHHLMLGIREKDFSGFPEAELYFEDLEGVIYDVVNRSKKPNMIMCVCSRTGLPKVKGIGINFPVPAWVPEGREYRQLLTQNKIQALEQEHQALQQKHQALQQSKAIAVARKLEGHPFLMKSASASYGVLAKIYRWFGGR